MFVVNLIDFYFQVYFAPHFNVGKISQDTIVGPNDASNNEEVRVQCFPLFSLLSALNVTVVDYFSLDVEGHEYQVLQTIPFDKVLIKVFLLKVT
jgi:FkbM family methyltransferase